MTSKNRYFDPKVWLTMGISTMLALGLLGYKAITYVDCDQYQIQVNTFHDESDGIAGEDIEFTLKSDKDLVVWHFGDGSDPIEGQKVRHKFFKAGTFTVTAEVDGRCIQFENINIRLKPFPSKAELNAMQEGIYGDSIVSAGNTLTLISTASAEQYQWQVIGKPNFSEQNDQRAHFVFDNPGLYTVQLVLDGEASKRHIKTIRVTAPDVGDLLNSPVLPDVGQIAGPTPIKIDAKAIKDKQEEEQQATQVIEKQHVSITDAEMKLLLNDLAASKKSVADFDKYLCNGPNTKTIVNGQATVFAELSSMLQGKKGILGMGGKKKIVNVTQTFDPDGNNCTVVLNIKLK